MYYLLTFVFSASWQLPSVIHIWFEIRICFKNLPHIIIILVNFKVTVSPSQHPASFFLTFKELHSVPFLLPTPNASLSSYYHRELSHFWNIILSHLLMIIISSRLFTLSFLPHPLFYFSGMSNQLISLFFPNLYFYLPLILLWTSYP